MTRGEYGPQDAAADRFLEVLDRLDTPDVVALGAALVTAAALAAPPFGVASSHPVKRKGSATAAIATAEKRGARAMARGLG